MAKPLSYIYVWTEREQAANDNYGGKQKIKQIKPQIQCHASQTELGLICVFF